MENDFKILNKIDWFESEIIGSLQFQSSATRQKFINANDTILVIKNFSDTGYVYIIYMKEVRYTSPIIIGDVLETMEFSENRLVYKINGSIVDLNFENVLFETVEELKIDTKIEEIITKINFKIFE